MRRAYRGRQVLAGGALLPDHAVVVRDGDIESVVPSASAALAGVETEDWGDTLILPGTVDVHTHSFQSLVRFADVEGGKIQYGRFLGDRSAVGKHRPGIHLQIDIV